MCTSDIELLSKKAARTAFLYLLISLFCALFGAVYEHFSHEVYSYYMIYAFAFPLTGGTLPFLTISLLHTKKYPGAVSQSLYHSGIATLTVGCILRGVLDIYGTTHRLVQYYWQIGFALLAAGILLYALPLEHRHK